MAASKVTPSTKHRRLPKIVIVIDELADLLLSHGKTGRTRYHAAGTAGSGRRDSSDARHPAAFGGRGHGPDQGESAGADFIAGNFAGRFTHDSRCNWRRALARRRRYAVYAAWQCQISPLAWTLCFRDRDSKALRFSASPGLARLSDGDSRNLCNGAETTARLARISATSSTTKRCGSYSRPARHRSR